MGSTVTLYYKAAPGMDIIPYEMILHLLQSPLAFMLKLFNRIIRDGTVPVERSHNSTFPGKVERDKILLPVFYKENEYFLTLCLPLWYIYTVNLFAG